MTDSHHNRVRPHGWWPHATDQATLAVFTAVAIAAIAVAWMYRGGLRGRLIDIDATTPAKVSFRLDINRADWPEWTVLPGIGETLAKRIVQDRSERGPFLSHADLLRVDGIGPRTFERMRPYLLPLPEADDLLKPKVAAQQ